MGAIISYFNPINYKELEERIKPIIKEIVSVEIEKMKVVVKDYDPQENDIVEKIGNVVLEKLEQVVDECIDNSCCK